MLVKTLVAASSMVLLQHPPLCSAYPTKEVLDLVDPSTKDGGDGGCDSSTHKYVQVDTINNLDEENTDYSVYFTQLTAECSQPFPSGYEPYSISGHFAPGDVEPDAVGRSQLNLYFCAPYGDYKIDIVVHGDFQQQDGKRIGWEIEDGQTQTHVWDTFNPAEYTNEDYNPMHPGSFSWPLPGETDEHMARYYVSRDMTSPPSDPECDDFVPGEQPESSPPSSGTSNDGGASVVVGAPLGCYTDSAESRVFEKVPGSSGSDITVQFCADFCFFAGYPCMGVEFGDECYCGYDVPAGVPELPDSACSMSCAGDPDAQCGGIDAIMIYVLDGEEVGGGAADEEAADEEESIPTPPTSGDGGSETGETATGGGGCYKDAKDARILTGTSIVKDENMTHELCAGRCTDAGMAVYGVEHGHECFCGAAMPDEPQIASSYCDTPCDGDVSQNCGGYDAILIVAL